MHVLVFFLMDVQMLVHKPAMKMHMLMNQICSQKKFEIIQYIFRKPIHLNAVIFAHDYGPFADLLYDFKVVRGGDYGLSGSPQFLQEFD